MARRRGLAEPRRAHPTRPASVHHGPVDRHRPASVHAAPLERPAPTCHVASRASHTAPPWLICKKALGLRSNQPAV